MRGFSSGLYGDLAGPTFGRAPRTLTRLSGTYCPFLRLQISRSIKRNRLSRYLDRLVRKDPLYAERLAHALDDSHP